MLLQYKSKTVRWSSVGKEVKRRKLCGGCWEGPEFEVAIFE